MMICFKCTILGKNGMLNDLAEDQYDSDPSLYTFVLAVFAFFGEWDLVSRFDGDRDLTCSYYVVDYIA